jgi:hypothetical protein
MDTSEGVALTPLYTTGNPSSQAESIRLRRDARAREKYAAEYSEVMPLAGGRKL